MILFSKALFLATTFPKIVKNSIFLLNYYQIFSKISKNFPTIVFVVQGREKSKHCLLNYLKNMLKECIICYFLKKFCENFRKFSGVRGGAPPPDPLRGRPPKMFPPPNRNHGGAAVYITGEFL